MSSTGPGHSALTRTPCRANCTPSSRDIERTAPFDAVYEICDVAAPTSATNDATLITEPPPRSRRYGIPYLQQRIDALRVDGLDAVPRVVVGLRIESSSGRRDAGVVVEHVDAAVTLGGGPYIARTPCGVSDVHLDREAASPASAAVCSAASPSMSAAQTCAPSSAKTIAASRPMPPPAPVITATLPSSRPITRRARGTRS